MVMVLVDGALRLLRVAARSRTSRILCPSKRREAGESKGRTGLYVCQKGKKERDEGKNGGNG